ncbi:hypothetical protein L1887_55348 [Cichorium endivia]|nr:hypothetical protein L1887_55348 [Cichorium endivia]
MAAHYPLGSSSTPPLYASGSSAAVAGSSSASSSYLGQTRSRTLLFLSYRESAGPSSRARDRTSSAGDVYFQAPYTDSDDPLGSSSLNQPGRGEESESHGLLSRRSHEGHIALAVGGQGGSELPPKWMDVSDQVDQILVSIRPRMERLSRLHEKHLRPGFADKSSEEQQIEALALDITKDFRRCSRLVAGLASFTQHLMREAQRNQSDVTVRQVALAQNVQTALATRVQDLSGAFRKQQSLYLKRMKGMEVRDRDIRAARGLAPPTTKDDSFRDSELAVREDVELSRQQLLESPSQSNLLLLDEEQQLSTADREIQQRSRGDWPRRIREGVEGDSASSSSACSSPSSLRSSSSNRSGNCSHSHHRDLHSMPQLSRTARPVGCELDPLDSVSMSVALPRAFAPIRVQWASSRAGAFRDQPGRRRRPRGPLGRHGRRAVLPSSARAVQPTRPLQHP